MKRILLPIFGLLILYVIYIDLTAGTLPSIQSEKMEVKEVTAKVMENQETGLPAFEAEVEPGETLISIVENNIDKPLPVSIDKLIKDFQSLNPGQTPEKIQIGKTYQFPDYSK